MTHPNGLSYRTERGTAPGGVVIVAEQFSTSLRNILILLVLTRAPGSTSANLIVAFTSAQMVASLAFAAVGEPAMLAPKKWLGGSGFRRVMWQGLAIAAVSAASTALISLFLGLGLSLVFGLSLIAVAMAWSDVERVLHFVGGNAKVPLIRNLCVMLAGGLVLMTGHLNTGTALAIVGIVWLFLCFVSWPRRRGPVDEMSAEWSVKRPAFTGLVDVGTSYAVIYGTLFLAMSAFGPLVVVPLRLAQSLLGPVQMMATGVRSALTVRAPSAVKGGRARHVVWLITPAFALVIVGVAFATPKGWGELVVGATWSDMLALLPALALQGSIVSLGAVGAARLRRLGCYTYVSLLRIVSGLLSLIGMSVLIRSGDNLEAGYVLLGLCLGPLVAAPFWINGKKRQSV